MGLHQEGHPARKFNVMRTLSRADGGIKQYTLVLPDRFDLEQSQDFFSHNIGGSLLPWIKQKSEVRMAIVTLKSRHYLPTGIDLLAHVAVRHNLSEEARARAWQVVEAAYDRMGHYTYKLNAVKIFRVGEAG